MELCHLAGRTKNLDCYLYLFTLPYWVVRPLAWVEPSAILHLGAQTVTAFGQLFKTERSAINGLNRPVHSLSRPRLIWRHSKKYHIPAGDGGAVIPPQGARNYASRAETRRLWEASFNPE